MCVCVITYISENYLISVIKSLQWDASVLCIRSLNFYTFGAMPKIFRNLIKFFFSSPNFAYSFHFNFHSFFFVHRQCFKQESKKWYNFMLSVRKQKSWHTQKYFKFHLPMSKFFLFGSCWGDKIKSKKKICFDTHIHTLLMSMKYVDFMQSLRWLAW